MQNILLVDFGSTFTKLCAVDLEKQDIIGTSKSFSTVEQDIRDGFENALDELYIKLGKKITFDQMIACSSAAGGLKMAAIGLVPELTVEASKRTCMGAGAKVDLVFSYKLTQEDINIIKNNNIDIILLSGGTDGGNTEMVQHNIEVLGNAKLTIPIIYAGNKALDSYAEEIFSKNGIEYYITENVMSKLNILNMKGAKETIHQIFLKRIVSAK
ncbi:MAG: glutamate mutase L, partial [Acholeplasmataceae bacterium]|nr:glutamate mutase L [Acholeplasmataceae bacterium]